MKATDDQLMSRMREGDEEAFAEIFSRYAAPIGGFAAYMGIPRSNTEDVAQEVFLTLVRNIRKFDSDRGSAASFLYGIARNRVLQWLRDHSKSNESALENEIGITAPEDPLVQYTKEEQIKLLRRAIQQLPEHYREVVILCEINELSYEETAQALSCAIGTVRSRLHRARSILAERIQSSGERELKNYELQTLETGSV